MSYMDFDKYVIKLNVKTLMLYEKLSGKSYSNINENDAMMLLYASIVVNNHDLMMSYDAFQTFIDDKKVLRWLMQQYSLIEKYNLQIKTLDTNTDITNDEAKEVPEITMGQIAAALIVKCHMDARYVLYDMELWEIPDYLKAREDDIHEKYENDRLWTYMTILPYVDGKKLKGPDSLLKFPWEKETDKDKALQDIENKQDRILRTFALMNKQDG